MKILVLFFFIFCGFNLNAQILPGKTNSLPSGGVLEAHFTQKRHLNGIPKPIESKGQMILWEGNGLVWSTMTPFPNTICITGKGLFQIENQNKIPLIKAGNESAIFEMLGGVFNIKDLKELKGFSLETLTGDSTPWKIRLTPQNSQVINFIKTLEIEGDEQISKLVIIRPNGDFDEIEIKDHIIKENVPPEVRGLLNE